MTVGELEFYLSLIKDKSLHVIVSSTERVAEQIREIFKNSKAE